MIKSLFEKCHTKHFHIVHTVHGNGQNFWLYQFMFCVYCLWYSFLYSDDDDDDDECDNFAIHIDNLFFPNDIHFQCVSFWNIK